MLPTTEGANDRNDVLFGRNSEQRPATCDFSQIGVRLGTNKEVGATVVANCTTLCTTPDRGDRILP
jgi:hypothetical protein